MPIIHIITHHPIEKRKLIGHISMGSLPVAILTGKSTRYMNGVISDASLNPGETGTFDLVIQIPDSINVTYWTKEIRADVFE